MARLATREELEAARRELDAVNQQHGFRRSEPTADRGGSDGPKANEPSAIEPPSANSTQAGSGGETAGTTPADPGPPRFMAVDIEHRLAQLSGGAIISIGEDAAKKLVAILIKELRASMAASLAAVAATHNHVAKLDQLEIPFGKPD